MYFFVPAVDSIKIQSMVKNNVFFVPAVDGIEIQSVVKKENKKIKRELSAQTNRRRHFKKGIKEK